MPHWWQGSARRALLALAAGAVVPLSFSPLELWPAGLLGIIGLCLALHESSAREGALSGLLFGLGLYGVGASWVHVSIAGYGNVGPLLAFFLTAGFVFILALLAALQCWLLQRFLPAWGPMGFASLWLLFEWLRGWLFTGFPWLYLGYAHVHSPLSPLAPVFGVMGLSFLVALTGSTLFFLLRRLFQSRRPVAAQLLLLCWPMLAGWLGAQALQGVQWVSEAPDGALSAGIVHGTIPQEEKFNPQRRLEHVDYYESMSEGLWGHDLILWPETAIAFRQHRVGPLLDSLDERARESDTTLISGIFVERNGLIHNSVLGLGTGEGLHHKQKLVPFGEYVPLRNLLGPLMQLFSLPMSDVAPGPHEQNLIGTARHQLAAFICYEVVYPDFVRRQARGADLLVTISNDTWFGESWGPRQHLQMAAMRALENGRYMLRATNHGLSAIIDPQGRILARSSQFDDQTLSGNIQAMSGTTPFALWGHWPVLLLSAICVGITAATRRKS